MRSLFYHVTAASGLWSVHACLVHVRYVLIEHGLLLGREYRAKLSALVRAHLGHLGAHVAPGFGRRSRRQTVVDCLDRVGLSCGQGNARQKAGGRALYHLRRIHPSARVRLRHYRGTRRGKEHQ